MKIYLNKYRYHWLSPYTICEKICFWREIDYEEPWVKTTNKVLTPVMSVCMKFLDIVHPKIDYVKIDKWDTWSMDSTLSPIILPMLKQLNEDKHGAPNTDDEDVPATLRSATKSAQKAKNDIWDPDGNHFRRWNWIMGEMIWAFEQLCDENNNAQFHSGVSDRYFTDPDEKGLCKWEKGPNDTSKFDEKGYTKHQERINNGLKLFGKYFRALWD